jgi:hypothetical protein
VEQELGIKLQENGLRFLTQVEVQSVKDEELRSLLLKRGYRILELAYNAYSDKKRDELYVEILESLGKTV